MIEPAALRKAKALAQHMFGLSQQTALVTLTDDECWEFLAWLPSLLHPDVLPEFELDLERAKAHRNPWEMIDASFTLLGFGITRVADLH